MLNQFFDKYIFTSTLKYTHNNFYLVNVPFIISPTDIFTSLIEKSDVAERKKIYFAVKESTQKYFMKRFDALGIKEDKQLDFVKTFFVASGWGGIQFNDVDFQGKRAIAVIENSPFAIELKGRIKFEADVFLRGILAGLFSETFKEDIDCVEHECLAGNSTNCKFIIKPKTEFDVSKQIVQDQILME